MSKTTETEKQYPIKQNRNVMSVDLTGDLDEEVLDKLVTFISTARRTYDIVISFDGYIPSIDRGQRTQK